MVRECASMLILFGLCAAQAGKPGLRTSRV
jgi:hypothetical protein